MPNDPFMSEIRYLGNSSVDFIEIAVERGSSVANLYIVNYNQNGTVKSTTQLTEAAVAGPTVSGGRDIYVVDGSSSFNGLNKRGAVALVESADGTTADNVFGFYSFNDQAGVVTAVAGLANGLSSVDIGQAGSGESLIIRKSDADNPDVADSGAYTVNTSPTEGTIPCFCPGTLITTVLGQKPVEALSAGDLVVTMDHGLQPVRWIGRRTISGIGRFDPSLRPVTLTVQNAPVAPAAPLRVSPNHRVLIRHAAVQALFGVPEALVAAQFLAPSDPQATDAALPGRFDYLHLLFDQHEVIFAQGAPVESLHPGHIALSAFGLPGKLLDLAGVHSAYGPAARRCLHRWEAKALVDALAPARPIDQKS